MVQTSVLYRPPPSLETFLASVPSWAPTLRDLGLDQPEVLRGFYLLATSERQLLLTTHTELPPLAIMRSLMSVAAVLPEIKIETHRLTSADRDRVDIDAFLDILGSDFRRTTFAHQDEVE